VTDSTYSANNIHVIWEHIRLTNVLNYIKNGNDERLLACDVLKFFTIKSNFWKLKRK